MKEVGGRGGAKKEQLLPEWNMIEELPSVLDIKIQLEIFLRENIFKTPCTPHRLVQL